VHWDWSIFAAAIGFGGMRALMFEYQGWKARRADIPLDWNPRTQAYEADFKLKRWEKIGRIAAWALWGGGLVAGIMVVNSY